MYTKGKRVHSIKFDDESILIKVKNKIKEIDKRYFIIFIIAVVICIPYMRDGIIKGHDYICHMANLFSIDNYISLKEGRIIPNQINPVMANNLGYGNAIFYPQLSYILTTIINLIVKYFGGSLITSVKIYNFFIVLFSGLVMYKLVNNVFKNKNVALASSIIYMSSSYLMFDIYIRMAYGETALFVFIPIVLISIHYILNQDYKKFIIYFVLGYCGMILSHLVMTVFFTILLAVILIINIKKLWNKKSILSFLFATIIVLGLTAPFIMPMLEHKVKGNYVVFQEDVMTYLEKISSHRLTLDDVIFNSENSWNIDKPKRISIIASILMGISILTYKNILKEKDQKRAFWSICIVTLLSFIISSTFVDWSDMPKILWNIQFPWRMCLFMSIGSSILAGLALLNFKNKENIKVVFILICVVCLTDVIKISHLKEVKITNPITYKESSSLENVACGAQREYLPVNAKNNMEYLKKRKQDVKVISGTGKDIKVLKGKTPYLKFEVDIENNQKVRLELPRIFYYGYQIKYEGEKELIDYYENEKGLIEIEVNKTGNIIVDYKGTNISKIAMIIFGISIIFYMMILIYKKQTDKSKRKSYIKNKNNK